VASTGTFGLVLNHDLVKFLVKLLLEQLLFVLDCLPKTLMTSIDVMNVIVRCEHIHRRCTLRYDCFFAH
jgi:hypothetical protein